MNYLLSESDRAKLNRLLRTMPGDSSAARPPRSAFPDRFPPPYTVRWSQSEFGGSGGWVIWLPDLAKLIAYGGEYKTITGVSASEVLPAGWYTIDDATETDDTGVWLNVTMSGDAVAASAAISVVAGQGSTGSTVWAIQIASLSVDAATSAKRVKQYVDSALHLAGGEGGGGSVSLDDISIDYNDNGEAQIKDFDAGAPAASTTVAADLVNGASNPDKFVCRNANGELVYKSPGNLGAAGGVTYTGLKIVTNIQWDSINHELQIAHATINIKNGIITSWVEKGDQAISTTAISDIISN